MPQSNGHKSAAKAAMLEESLPAESTAPEARSPKSEPAASIDPNALEDTFSALKTLLNTAEKLQKSRQEVGDIKPQLLRLLDGELLSEEELEQLKTGVNGLSKLVRFYGDYQTALEKAQPARALLDQVIK